MSTEADRAVSRMIIRRLLSAAERELWRQSSEGALTHVGPIDVDGRLDVTGTLDLPALYDAMEKALRSEFVG